MFLVEGNDLYKYQVAHADMDPFIKILLRTYTGLFTEYASIYEADLAKKTGTDAQIIYKALQKLSKAGIIHYIPRRKTPLITYLQSREELQHLRLPPEVYEKRKQQYMDQVGAVIEYGSSDHICRSRLLLNYFGQSKSENCGICDVCLSRRKTGLTDTTFNDIEKSVENILKEHPMEAEKLVDTLGFDKKHTWDVLKWLEDHEIIGEMETGEMEWLK